MTYTAQTEYHNPYENYIMVKVDCRRNHFFSELHIWLHKHAKGHWTTSTTRVGFELEEDAIYFKLAWPG